ncbi:hypothetical protein F2981_09085 [Sinorhizobium meliloti]|nr:hypothetical protein [Sinorhizobium meliloti]
MPSTIRARWPPPSDSTRSATPSTGLAWARESSGCGPRPPAGKKESRIEDQPLRWNRSCGSREASGLQRLTIAVSGTDELWLATVTTMPSEDGERQRQAHV